MVRENFRPSKWQRAASIWSSLRFRVLLPGLHASYAPNLFSELVFSPVRKVQGQTV